MIVKILNKKMIYYIYCDESGIKQHKYMVIGGLIIKKEALSVIEEHINKVCNELNIKHEMKFTKITKEKLETYKKIIDIFFIYRNTHQIKFKAIIIDTEELDKKIDKEYTFMHMYYQLLYHCFIKQIETNNNELHIYDDKRNTKSSLEEFKKILSSKHNQQIKTLEYRDSKDNKFIQIVDF